MAILPLINLSLNETLARTVVTSMTVLIALGVLMLIGPEVIFGLAIAIFLGVVIGTYSSIYISAPVLVWLGVQPDSFLKSDDSAVAKVRDILLEGQAEHERSPGLAPLVVKRIGDPPAHAVIGLPPRQDDLRIMADLLRQMA